MGSLFTFHRSLFLSIFLAILSSVFGYDLTIVHNNDVHAHFDQTSVLSGDCSKADAEAGQCYGGEARRVTIIKDARANIQNTVVLDAGDRFVGKFIYLSIYLSMSVCLSVCMSVRPSVCAIVCSFIFSLKIRTQSHYTQIC